MADNTSTLWESAKRVLERETSAVTYNTWIKVLKPELINDEHFLLESPDQFHCDYSRQYLDLIQNTMDSLAPGRYKVDIMVSADMEQRIAELRAAQPLHAPVETLNSQQASGQANGHGAKLNPELIFETFVVGQGNRFAHAACEAVAKQEGGRNFNPLFLYGGSGLGKTHLMQAIGNYALSHMPKRKLIYVQCEQFVNEFIYTIQSGKYDSFRNKYRNCDLLLIDDIQFLEGKEQMQIEFFHTFNALYENGSNIVLTSDKPPQSLATLEDRLVTRFASGLIVDIQAPDYETRVAILKKRAEQSKLNLPEDVYHYIAANISSNIRELEGALKTVMAYSMLAGEVSLALAKEALKDIISPASNRKVTPELIADVVSRYYGVVAADLSSNRKNKEIAYPRQVAMYLCREVLDISYEQIGQVFGGRHYSTVMHNCDKIRSEIDADETHINTDIAEIKKRIQI